MAQEKATYIHYLRSGPMDCLCQLYVHSANQPETAVQVYTCGCNPAASSTVLLCLVFFSGILYIRQNDLEDAFDVLSQLLELDPSDSVVARQLEILQESIELRKDKE